MAKKLVTIRYLLGKNINTVTYSLNISKTYGGTIKQMKKTIIVISICAFLLVMPTILAAPLMNHPASLFSPTKSSNGTFAGGMGRGHWGFGNFNIDTTHAYLAGVYTSGAYIRLTGEIKNSNYDIIGEISATIIFK